MGHPAVASGTSACCSHARQWQWPTLGAALAVATCVGMQHGPLRRPSCCMSSAVAQLPGVLERALGAGCAGLEGACGRASSTYTGQRRRRRRRAAACRGDACPVISCICPLNEILNPAAMSP